MDMENEEVQELDLNNPIFVFYMSVEGMSRQRAEESAQAVMKQFGYSNITMWFIAIPKGETRIECVYDGVYKQKTIRKVLDVINDFPDVEYYAEIKSKIREILIDELV